MQYNLLMVDGLLIEEKAMDQSVENQKKIMKFNNHCELLHPTQAVRFRSQTFVSGMQTGYPTS